jgi:PAS domain-containing protein
LPPEIHLSEATQSTQTLRLTHFAVDHSLDSIIWIASDSRHVYVNDAACRLLGYTKEELLASTVCEQNPNLLPKNGNSTGKKLSVRVLLCLKLIFLVKKVS